MRYTSQKLIKTIDFVTQKSSGFIFAVVCFFVFSLFTFLIPSAQSTATPPAIITYQGKLLQDSASVTSTQDMAFFIFDATTAGNLLYTASGTPGATSTIEVDFGESSAGNFSVQLGGSGTNALSGEIFANNTSLYLEVWVEGTRLSPRRRLTSVPYALNSQYLLGISASSTSSTTYIPHSDNFGNFQFTGNPQSALPGGGVIYINPTSTDANETLFAIAVGGGQRFRVDTDGDTDVNGNLTVSSTFFVNSTSGNVGINTSSPNYNLSVNGNSYFGATSTFAGLIRGEGRVRAPQLFSSFIPGVGSVYDVEVIGDYAYVAGLGGGLRVVDVSRAGNPTEIGSLLVGSDVDSIKVVGNYAYLGTTGSALHVVDVSRPSDPVEIGNLNFGGSVTDMEIVGNYGYIAGNNDFHIVDFTDPAHPTIISTYAAPAASNVVVNGKYAYVSDPGFQLLRVVDISNPLNILEVESVAITNSPGELLVSGKFLYLADASGDELVIFDISDPHNLVEISTFDPGGFGSSQGMDIAGNFLYLAFGTSGTHIIDITNKTNPQLILTYAPSVGITKRVKAIGNLLYVADSGGGLHIVDMGGAQINHANLGTVDSHNLHVRNRTQFDGNVLVNGGVNIGSGGLLIGGGISMFMPTSTVNATNTLNFSHAAVFESSVSSSYSNAFVFNTRYTLSNATTTYLLSIRNNDSRVFSVSTNGDVITTGTYYGLGGAFGTPGTPGDLAEQVDIALDDSVEAGDVIIVDPSAPDTYRRSQSAYERAVAGVISTNPTITIGYGKTQHTALLAMVGRVPIKVTAENGQIARGDLLVSASKPGYAMKYDPAKDDGVKVVGIIGVALDPLVAQEGKILSLVKSGWINNRNETLSEIQQDLIELAEVDGVSINTNPQDLLVEQSGNGDIHMISQNLNLNGYYIVNAAGIYGKNNQWQIDEEGRFITRVKTSEGDKSLYALQSEKTEYVFSGSGILQNGIAEIVFPTSTREILDPEKTITVSVTLTSEANGVFITNKSTAGFTVKELLGGEGTATFDWVVIAERKSGNLIDSLIIPEEEPLIENNQNPEPVMPQGVDPVEEPIILPVDDINDPIEENPPVEVVPEPEVPAEDPPAEVLPEVPEEVIPEPIPEPAPEAPAPDPAL